MDKQVIKQVRSSFVYNKIKLKNDTGSGEAKFHIGSARDEIEKDLFFNNYAETNIYTFNKVNLINYMYQVKLEYAYQQFNQYKSVNLDYWDKMFTEINRLDDEEFRFKLSKFVDKNRYYIRSENKIFKEIFRKISLPLLTNLRIDKKEESSQISYLFSLELNFNMNEAQENEIAVESDKSIKGINKMFYGAPGTGKSHKVHERYYNDACCVRVTFHSNYSYSDFVGYIRPVAEGEKVTYSFVPGPFIDILIKALNNPDQIHTLIIEEINRANAASVFGDLFQLLDRDNQGISEYSVYNQEIYKVIKDKLGEKYLAKEGFVYIPNNLNIIATMNTADQNVFVMDTAFKRRWEYEYVAVEFNDSHQFKDTVIANLDITWENFVIIMNKYMLSKENEDLMIAEDKQIGPYFVKEEELHDPQKFAYKVLLYLWDDVFKIERYRLFNDSIRSFSALVTQFDSRNCMDIFQENIKNIFKTLKHTEISGDSSNDSII